MSDEVTIGRPPAVTVGLIDTVRAVAWLVSYLGSGKNLAAKSGCGVTLAPETTTGIPLTRTVATPLIGTPPHEFGSVILTTPPAIYYPKISFLLGTSIPVVTLM
jgi:hypothetical protein